MARPFRFAIQTGPFDDPAALRDVARHIEQLGYAELFSYDHLGAIDPFLPLLIAAEATTTLKFGPLVINNEFHNPVLLARAAATFDRLSGGRLVLGMGTGYMRSEHDAADIELRSPGPRVTRFGESLTVLRSLLDTDTATFDGEHVRVAVERLGVRPASERVPFLIGGHGRRVVELAAHHADIFQYTGLTHEPGTGAPGAGGFDPAALQQRWEWFRECAGDRLGQIDISALVQVTAIGDDVGDERLAAAERLEMTPEVLDEIPFVLIGSVGEVADKLHRLRERLGIHHFVVRDPDGFAPVVDALRGQ